MIVFLFVRGLLRQFVFESSYDIFPEYIVLWSELISLLHCRQNGLSLTTTRKYSINYTAKANRCTVGWHHRFSITVYIIKKSSLWPELWNIFRVVPWSELISLLHSRQYVLSLTTTSKTSVYYMAKAISCTVG